MLGTLLIVVLIFMFLGAFPLWHPSKGWGSYSSGGLGLLLAAVILVLLGRI